jgi:hypothetical protein
VTQYYVIKTPNYVFARYEINRTFYTVTDINKSKMRFRYRKGDSLLVIAHFVFSLVDFYLGLNLNNSR